MGGDDATRMAQFWEGIKLAQCKITTSAPPSEEAQKSMGLGNQGDLGRKNQNLKLFLL